MTIDAFRLSGEQALVTGSSGGAGAASDGGGMSR